MHRLIYHSDEKVPLQSAHMFHFFPQTVASCGLLSLYYKFSILDFKG